VGLALLCCVGIAQAETVHLKSGEIIKGKIVRIDPDTLSIESDKGLGVIRINRSDISLIEFDRNERDQTRPVGLGYYHRSTPSSVGAEASAYGSDALSFKMWTSNTEAVDFLLGFYDSEDATSTLLKVLTFDVRWSRVFKRHADLDLYYGGSLGYLRVTDNTSGRSLDDNGYSVRAFLGIELFFATLPNIGISSELSIGSQSVGTSKTTNLATTTFPSFSIRYYY